MKTPAQGVDVANVLNDIEALRRARRLYPSDHPSIPPARQRTRERTLRLASDEPATLGIAPDGFLWCGEMLPIPPNAPATRLLAFLFQLGLAAIRMTFPAAGDGMVQFAERLSTLNDPPGEADRERLLASQAEMPGIELITIDVSDVQLVDETSAAAVGADGVVWAEMLVEMVRRGSLSHLGVSPEAELTPQGVVDILSTAANAESILDFVFAQLAEAVRNPAHGKKPLPLGHVRTFLRELLALLPAERRRLAVVVASRHLPLDQQVGPERATLVDLGLVLDATEQILSEGRQAPESLVELVERIADSEHLREVASPAARAQAAALLARLGARAAARPDSVAAARSVEIHVDWEQQTWARALTESLGEAVVRRHLVQVYAEVSALWPDDQIADLAAERLADNIIDTIEVGDFELADRLARMLAVTRQEDARRLAAAGAVQAAVKAYRVFDAQQHPAIDHILATLGATAIPDILAALADSEDKAVRKRLLTVVISLGEGAVPQVRRLLDDQRWYVVRNAVFLLRRLGDPELASLARARVASAPPQVLAEILKALVLAEDPGWLQAILREVDGGDEQRGLAALAVASHISHAELASQLAARLHGRIGRQLREPFTIELIRTLRQLRDPVALPVLEELVSLRQWRYPFSLTPVRAEAAAAIAAVSTPAARKLALALQQDRDAEVAQAARSVHLRADERAKDEP